jgi:hypothetical protein
VEDLDREVLTLLTEDAPDFLAGDQACTVVRVDDAVAQLEVDVLENEGDLVEFGDVDVGLVANGELLG